MSLSHQLNVNLRHSLYTMILKRMFELEPGNEAAVTYITSLLPDFAVLVMPDDTVAIFYNEQIESQPCDEFIGKRGTMNPLLLTVDLKDLERPDFDVWLRRTLDQFLVHSSSSSSSK
jgi:hypothetical protein